MKVRPIPAGAFFRGSDDPAGQTGAATGQGTLGADTASATSRHEDSHGWDAFMTPPPDQDTPAKANTSPGLPDSLGDTTLAAPASLSGESRDTGAPLLPVASPGWDRRPTGTTPRPKPKAPASRPAPSGGKPNSTPAPGEKSTDTPSSLPVRSGSTGISPLAISAAPAEQQDAAFRQAWRERTPEAIAAGRRRMEEKIAASQAGGMDVEMERPNKVPTASTQEEYRQQLTDPARVVELSRRADGMVVINADDIVAESPDMKRAKKWRIRTRDSRQASRCMTNSKPTPIGLG